MTASERDAAVLEYYAREVEGVPCPPDKPLAGLTLAGFRGTRNRLISEGHLTRRLDGRYVPTHALVAA